MNALLLALSGKFPLWEDCLSHNAKLADIFIIRVDANGLTPDIEKGLGEVLRGKKVAAYSTNTPMDKWNWREELLTHLHQSKEDVDYVLFPDEDEKLPLDLELKEHGQYMFDYEMVTNGHETYKYPTSPHSKVYKYHPQLTYKGYQSFARVNLDGVPYKEVECKEKVKHYCFFEKEWMEKKERSILHRYPDYFEKFPKDFNCA